jgi:hypothetical protein
MFALISLSVSCFSLPFVYMVCLITGFLMDVVNVLQSGKEGQTASSHMSSSPLGLTFGSLPSLLLSKGES